MATRAMKGILPSSAFCNHSTNFFIWSRKTLLPLATWASLYHFSIASSLRTSAAIAKRSQVTVCIPTPSPTQGTPTARLEPRVRAPGQAAGRQLLAAGLMPTLQSRRNPSLQVAAEAREPLTLQACRQDAQPLGNLATESAISSFQSIQHPAKFNHILNEGTTSND